MNEEQKPQETVEIVVDPTALQPQPPIDPPIPPQVQEEQLSSEVKRIWSPNGELVEYEGEMPTLAELIELTKKHEGGRPCEYCKRKDEIDKVTREYIQSARDKKGTKDAFVPYQQELADMLDVDGDTVYQWTIKQNEDNSLEHEEFSGLIKKLNNLKELFLLKRTMGRFNPTGAIFQLKTKHGYMETDKRVLAGDSNEPLEIVITEEERNKNGE